jgi:hypothetical protein
MCLWCVCLMVLGDGVQDVQVDAAGGVWVSYFDEGVLGNYRWTNPIGVRGLLRFSIQGEIEWEYAPPPGCNPILDCDALNVWAQRAWACYDSTIAEVDAPGNNCRAWKMSGCMSPALAVDTRPRTALEHPRIAPAAAAVHAAGYPARRVVCRVA